MAVYHLFYSDSDDILKISGDNIRFSIVGGLMITYELSRVFLSNDPATDSQELFNIWKANSGKEFSKILVHNGPSDTEYRFNKPLKMEYLLNSFREASSRAESIIDGNDAISEMKKESLIFKEFII